MMLSTERAGRGAQGAADHRSLRPAPRALRPRLALALTLALALPLPLLAQRHELGDRELVPPTGQRDSLLSASSDSGHLLLWRDGRTSPTGSPYPTQTFATRISPDGEVLDPSGIAVEPYAGFGVVASDGDDYLFLARSLRGFGLEGVRLTADGTVIPLPPLPIYDFLEALAWNGSEYGLLHEAQDGLRLTPLNRDGSIRGGSIAFPRCDGSRRLAGAQGRWLVAAGPCRAVIASTDFPPGAGSTKEVAFSSENNSLVIALVSDGAGFLAVRWTGPSYEIDSLGADGQVVATTRLRTPAEYTATPTLGRDGDAILLADGLQVIRVSPSGEESLQPPGATVRAELQVLPSPSGALAAWIDGRFARTVYDLNDRQVAAAVIGSPAWNAGGTIVSRGLRWQDDPVIGRGGATIVAAWTETSALPLRVAIQVLAPDGRPLAAPLHFENVHPYVRPAIAFDGSSFLVLWPYSTDGGRPFGFRGVRLAADGTFAGEVAPIDDPNASYTTISLTGDNGGWNLATDFFLYRLRPDGSVVERRPLPVSVLGLQPLGNEWLGLAYSDYIPPVGSTPVPREWSLVRLDAPLRRHVPEVVVGFGRAGEGDAAFAWNGERGLVVWWDGRTTWKALPLGKEPFGPGIAPDGEARVLAHGATGGDAQVEVTEDGFFVAGGDVLARHELDGSLAALHRLPRGARKARLLPLGSREALAVYAEPVDGVLRVFAGNVVLSPKRRAAGK